ncbi:hypothetical protein FCT18_03030 [Lysinibacillus sphaericus]|uniref:Uncharacterized protein n=1 Tax=Lysinibacillus sphaericus TaxID=1421 RepID=A0A2S0K3A3_LYSSH|nr:hypothetical protein [Lysinibacillus sphaericus]AVK97865.1 hypothetical protein LS41612_17050 [Lysinibacillus sphaericus]MED4543359.1 hypothetical protein [Lysinibacillus sphaericus]TKI21100.1 hypothetical protein FCT18_03030 [Lysinibacillus sphaericus]SUV16202.1 Uncharacterised protein [Lysinibacillus sphaericus]GEC81939.1 hypothetical protein LSP03_16820 [Lysinibacillus sphaericus]
MKKFMFVLFLLLVSIGIEENRALAESITAEVNDGNENDIDQEEIDRRLGIVFDYLNEHANHDFNDEPSVVYDIPVGEGIIVNAEISNQEVSRARTIGSSRDSIKANTNYNYSLRLTNIVGSGDITIYTVNYTTGSPIAPGKDVYRITVNNVSILGIPPSGFIVGNTNTYIKNNNNIIVSTGGYILYKRVLLADKIINFNDVSLGSLVGGTLVVNYSYRVN